MGGRRPELPDAVVGRRPQSRRLLREPLNRAPVIAHERRIDPLEDVRHVQDLAVDIQLQLGGRRVPDPHRTGSEISLEVGGLDLLVPVIPLDRIDRMKVLAGPELVGAGERPLRVGPRFRHVAEQEEHLRGERGVPYPYEPVVPVAGPPRPLGKRGGGGGHEHAGVRVTEELEDELGALDPRLPTGRDPSHRSLRRRDPGAPVGVGDREELARRGVLRRRIAPTDLQEERSTGNHRSRCDRGRSLLPPRPRGGEREAAGFGRRHRKLRADRPAGDLESVAEPRVGPHADLDGSSPGDQAPHDAGLSGGRTGDRTGGHEIRDREHDPPAEIEEGRQDVRARDVLLVGDVRSGRPDGGVSSAASIEQPAERARRVEAREACPIDRSMARDQGGGPLVPDEAVVVEAQPFGEVGIRGDPRGPCRRVRLRGAT